VWWFALPVLLAVAVPPARGAQIYATACSTCHGAQKSGSKDGPSLHGVGGASLDFELMTGRMPAAVPWIEVAHRDERAGQQLPLADVRALEVYLAPVVSGGPPRPFVANGDAERGQALYAANCEACHAVGGNGGALGGLDWVPALHEASINVVADAIRAGPYEMPRFGERQLDQTSLNDLAAYVIRMESVTGSSSPPFRSTGPVPEGAVGYLTLIALVAFVFTFWRIDARGGGRGR
jgi:ubiquinol-cytochrome c reductase cytochrome c subunit